ncbi:hypothetical protein DH2020_041618 [Rehmannia glutinosa]|uniref:Pentatricopeptide repeat-containing protein n=1 Tax=Rehmannia glutinosa TaxID=99300 RepID=A0ABR0UR40_REHGL
MQWLRTWLECSLSYEKALQRCPSAFDHLEKNADCLKDLSTYSHLISACSSLRTIEYGRKIHNHILKSKLLPNMILENHILNMYGKCGSTKDATKVFDNMRARNVVTWTALIAGYSQNGLDIEAIKLYIQMQQSDFMPDQFTFGSVIKACSSLNEVGLGGQLHAQVIKSEFGSHLIAQNALIAMYTKFGQINKACDVFSCIKSKDLISWSSMIAGFSKLGYELDALCCFKEMLSQSTYKPNEFIFGSVFSACASLGQPEYGKQIHGISIKYGFEADTFAGCALTDIDRRLCIWGDANEAMTIFSEMRHLGSTPDDITVRSLLCGFTDPSTLSHGNRMMLLVHGKPDHITLANVLGACGKVASLEMGDHVYCCAMKSGLEFDIMVMNGLIDMFVKCGSLERARKLFDLMGNQDAVSWSSLIVGYAQFGNGEEALNLFRRMKNRGVKPNQVTLVGVLTACSHVGLVDEGMQLFKSMEHEHEAFIDQMVIEPDIVMWKTLLAACKNRGNVEVGKRVAENILKIDPSNSAAHVLLCGIYASAGDWEDVAALRTLMREKGVKKVPGTSWIEVKDKIHVFSAEDGLHPERDKIFSMLEELWLQILDAGYVPPLE